MILNATVNAFIIWYSCYMYVVSYHINGSIEYPILIRLWLYDELQFSLTKVKFLIQKKYNDFLKVNWIVWVWRQSSDTKCPLFIGRKLRKWSWRKYHEEKGEETCTRTRHMYQLHTNHIYQQKSVLQRHLVKVYRSRIV